MNFRIIYTLSFLCGLSSVLIFILKDVIKYNKIFIETVDSIKNLISVAYLKIYDDISTSVNKSVKNVRLFNCQDLKNFRGVDSKEIYLSFLGKVYNVTKGHKYYGPSGAYHFFTGKDASRAYVTGDFTDSGLTDDLKGLTRNEYFGLSEWIQFYDKEYVCIGKLIGPYFDENGQITEEGKNVNSQINDAIRWKKSNNIEKKIFPPCNSEWSQEKGTKVWCSNLSGGIARDWVGVPRQLFKVNGWSRCACVQNSGPSTPGMSSPDLSGNLNYPHLRQYPGCPPDDYLCYIS